MLLVTTCFLFEVLMRRRLSGPHSQAPLTVKGRQ
jgi:hypothetical protein